MEITTDDAGEKGRRRRGFSGNKLIISLNKFLSSLRILICVPSVRLMLFPYSPVRGPASCHARNPQVLFLFSSLQSSAWNSPSLSRKPDAWTQTTPSSTPVPDESSQWNLFFATWRVLQLVYMSPLSFSSVPQIW